MTQQPQTSDRRLHRAAFFAAVLVFGIAVHQSLAADLFGLGPMKFFRRQSEAYAMVLGVVLFWELFARGAHPASRQPSIDRTPTSPVGQLAFFATLIVISILLPISLGLPQSIVTLKEALVAVIGIGAYLGWSRGFLAPSQRWGRGAPTVSWVLRAMYYVVIVGITVAAYKPSVHQALGAARGNWLQENSEAFGALIAIPLFFDVAARSRSMVIRLAWYGLIIAVPVVVQFSGMPEVGHSFAGWIQQMTEAFIAAVLISLYFDVVAKAPVEDPRSNDPQRGRSGSATSNVAADLAAVGG